MRTIIQTVIAGMLLCSGPAFAQNNAAPVDPKGCAPSERLQTDGKAPEGKAGEPLSDKLARTGGVICPPNIDPEIKAPTPQSGSAMPVIPPPSGDSSVQPK